MASIEFKSGETMVIIDSEKEFGEVQVDIISKIVVKAELVRLGLGPLEHNETRIETK